MPHKARFWVTVKATRSQISNKVSMVRGVKLSQNKPDGLTADSEAIEIELEFPDGYFDQNHPKVEITVPALPKDPVIKSTAQIKGRKPTAAAAVIQRS